MKLHSKGVIHTTASQICDGRSLGVRPRGAAPGIINDTQSVRVCVRSRTCTHTCRRTTAPDGLGVGLGASNTRVFATYGKRVTTEQSACLCAPVPTCTISNQQLASRVATQYRIN